MSYQPFLVSDLKEGLVNGVEPWILPDKAYPRMSNMFSYDGAIQKKGGNNLIGRLGIREEDLVVGAAGVTVVNMTLTWFPIEPGTLVITDGTTIFTDDGVGGFTITGGAGTVNAPTNYTTGVIDITFTNAAATITALYYVAVGNNSMVMGLKSLELDISVDYDLIAFDRLKSYKYDNTNERFENIATYKTSGDEINWTGSDSDFFWTTNFEEGFWATNNIAGGHFYAITAITKAAAAVITIGVHGFVNGDRVYINHVQGMTQINNQIGTITATAATTITVNINSAAYGVYTSGGIVWSIEKTKSTAGDGIRWYDDTNGWINFAPALSSVGVPSILQGCLMIIPFQSRMICFNTIEGITYAGNKRHSNRIRWSAVSRAAVTPYVALSFPALSGITTSASDSWYEQPGRGGYFDLPIEEEIVSVSYLKNSMVIYCEKSTWRMDSVGLIDEPFKFTKINSELGSESTFSTVPFDKETITVGSNAISTCDIANVVRIDDKIPELVFGFHNDESGNKRVHGIRDFYNSVILWTYTDASFENNGVQSVLKYPNRELIYNYKDNSWAVFKNYYTCYGHYRRGSDLTWGGADFTWASADITWDSHSAQSLFPYIVAGNTNGFVFEIQDVDHKDAPSANDTFYVIQDVSAANPAILIVRNHGLINGDHVHITGVNGVTNINDNIYKVADAADNSLSLIDVNGTPFEATGAYTYGGYVTVIDNFELVTKNFNPFYTDASKVKVGFIDLLLDNTTNGEITLELYTDTNSTDYIDIPISLVDIKATTTNKFWYRAFINVACQSFSFKLKYNETQIFDKQNNEENVKLHGWIFYAAPIGRLV